jgi:hypothetical protein
MFLEKKDAVAISNVCLLSLFNQLTLPADVISVQMEGELTYCFVE